ncbi:hypothetical protein [Clostridium tetani]|nr:hypothetical protein [Clostridium tetani]
MKEEIIKIEINTIAELAYKLKKENKDAFTGLKLYIFSLIKKESV